MKARRSRRPVELKRLERKRVHASLQAPVVRVTGYDTVMPYYRNEQYYLPQVEDIVTAVEQVIAL